MSMPAGFSTNALSLVDRGFVYAIGHVRGGKDKGYRWYKEGKRENKVNTFTDFIAAGEFLAAQGFTSRGRIVAHGGSAGGMLMGAVANMAPELFLGIIAEVPFVDVLTTMLDASLPLTPPEWPEWGNPIESEADYRTIAAIRLTTMCGSNPIRIFSRLLVSPIRASPIENLQNGLPSCGSSPLAMGSSYCRPTWRRATPARLAASSG